MSTRTLLRRPSRSLALALSAAAILAAGCGRAETSDRRPPSAEPGLSFKERMDRSHRGMEQPSRAATNAPPAEQMAGVGRPCSEAQDFDYYYLGRSFEGLELTTTDRNCEPPPKKIRAANGAVVYQSPGRVNVVSYIYGNCDKSGVIEGGCLPPLSVSSHPACERPHSLYSRFSGGGPPMHHQHIRVRGAPAAVFQDGSPGKGGRTRVEIYTADAAVVVAGRDPDLVTRAARKLVAPARSSGGARDAVSDLPLPRRGAAEDDAKENPPC